MRQQESRWQRRTRVDGLRCLPTATQRQQRREQQRQQPSKQTASPPKELQSLWRLQERSSRRIVTRCELASARCCATMAEQRLKMVQVAQPMPRLHWRVEQVAEVVAAVTDGLAIPGATAAAAAAQRVRQRPGAQQQRRHWSRPSARLAVPADCPFVWLQIRAYRDLRRTDPLTSAESSTAPPAPAAATTSPRQGHCARRSRRGAPGTTCRARAEQVHRAAKVH